jgi:hypothetical protein
MGSPFYVGDHLLGGAPPCERPTSLYSRGPRSGPGYVVLVRHHLIGPIRPTRRHTAISPHSGLYAVLRCAGAPRRPASGSALYLLDPSQHVDLYVPGEPLAAYSQFLRDAHLPSPAPIRFGTPNVGLCRGLLVHHCYNLLGCSPPYWRLLRPGFQRVGHPSRCRI